VVAVEIAETNLLNSHNSNMVLAIYAERRNYQNIARASIYFNWAIHPFISTGQFIQELGSHRKIFHH
jgi:hypothetical protein